MFRTVYLNPKLDKKLLFGGVGGLQGEMGQRALCMHPDGDKRGIRSCLTEHGKKGFHHRFHQKGFPLIDFYLVGHV